MLSLLRRAIRTLRRSPEPTPGSAVEPPLRGPEPVRYESLDAPRPDAPGPLLVVSLAEPEIGPEAARRWQERQSYRPLWIAGLGADGSPTYLLDAAGVRRPLADLPEIAWTVVAPGLPDWPASRLESAALVAASEAVDAVRLGDVDGSSNRSLPELLLYRTAAFDLPPRTAAPRAKRSGLLWKELGVEPGSDPARDRRGDYASDAPVASRVALFDAARSARAIRASSAPRLLVLAPFLARGGAEHTLFETARALAASHEFEFAFVTLAPHRPELGDRRADFREVSPLVYSLGDLLHPDAMYGALLSLVDSLDTRLLYNANGSTLFYDFARRIRRDRPSIPIVDHLYDHEVGYITWYDAETPSFVDYCVAENRRIAEKLVAAGWERERVPVIWPCGRPATAFPPATDRAAVRAALRRELGVGDGELLLLTAARAHPQKRPLDWVRLGERLRGEAVRLLWVGGGDLERELDEAIAASTAGNLKRLPFRDDVPKLLLAADAACLVSEFEGLPVFLLEALQAGRPFVATDVGDIGDLARSTGAGLVSGPPGDLDALDAAIRRLLDPAGRATLAERAAATGAGYGVEGCARRYGDLFQRALGSR